MKSLLLLILLGISQVTLAQGLKVKFVKETVSGIDAFQAPIDNNGHPCGLVKVQTTLSDLTFSGNVVGNVENKTNEYYVYLAKGSNSLVVKSPNFLPLSISFIDYGISEIESKATYVVNLKELSFNKKKTGVLLNVKPREAMVFIDNNLIENNESNGAYSLFLPKGDYSLRVECKGYRSSAQFIQPGKGTLNLNVELESLMAELEVSCMTSSAEIYVNGEKKGTGSWKGELPAGTYLLEAKKDGFVDVSQNITLSEKDNRLYSFPQLKRSNGKIFVISDPEGCIVTLDGNRVNNTVENVPTGKHIIQLSMPFGYKDAKTEIDVIANKCDTVKFKLEPTNSLYERAFQGDYVAQFKLAQEREKSKHYNKKDSIESNYWYDLLLSNIDQIGQDVLLKYGSEIEWHYVVFGDINKRLKILLKREEIHSKSESREEAQTRYGSIAECYENMAKYDKAIFWRKKALKSADQGTRNLCYKNLAKTYEIAGDKINAILFWKKVAMDGGDWGTVDLADAYYRLGYKTEAIRCYKDLLNNWDERIYKELKNEWRKKIRELDK